MKKLKSILFSLGGVNIVLLLMGAGLRLKHFSDNTPFWLDEAYVAADLSITSFKEILAFQTLYPAQPRTPFFFQILSKLSLEMFGPPDASFRLVSLVSGLAGLVLFYILLKKISSGWTRTAALAFFVFNNHLIRYSAELKPYSSDVMVALIVILLFLRLQERRFAWKESLFYGVLAAGLLWMSFSSVFVIFPLLGMAVLVHGAGKRDVAMVWRAALALLLPMVSMAVIYKVFMQQMVGSDYIKRTWEGSFLPWDQGLQAGISWIGSSFIEVFRNPFDATVPLLAFLFFLAGCYSLFKRNPGGLLILFSPLLAVFLAAILQKYPFKERMLLFLVPLLSWWVAEGIAFISGHSRKAGKVIGLLLCGILLGSPIAVAFHHLKYPRLKEDNRPIMEFLAEHIRPNDVILYNNSAEYALVYYGNALGMPAALRGGRFEVSSPEGDYYTVMAIKTQDFTFEHLGNTYINYKFDEFLCDKTGFTGRLLAASKLSGKVFQLYPGMNKGNLPPGRLWLFLSSINEEPRQFLLRSIDSVGSRLKGVEAHGAAVYLYYIEGK